LPHLALIGLLPETEQVELQLSWQTGVNQSQMEELLTASPGIWCQSLAAADRSATSRIPAAALPVRPQQSFSKMQPRCTSGSGMGLKLITRVIFCVFLETDFAIYKKKMSVIFPGEEEIDDEEEGDNDAAGNEDVEMESQNPAEEEQPAAKAEDDDTAKPTVEMEDESETNSTETSNGEEMKDPVESSEQPDSILTDSIQSKDTVEKKE
ncbi:hypothetical protein KUCAC02_024634, partial [Chaenocephalus aceratus]